MVSDHRDHDGLVNWHGIRFHHLRVAPEGKPEGGRALLDLVAAAQLVVLACPAGSLLIGLGGLSPSNAVGTGGRRCDRSLPGGTLFLQAISGPCDLLTGELDTRRVNANTSPPCAGRHRG